MKDFSQIFDRSYFRPVPADCWLLITDVAGSTAAIQKGKYKDVNAAGSLAAMSVANILGHMDFPFIFGGDGSTCLVPPQPLAQIRRALTGLIPLVKDLFDLDLRAALIPIQDLLDQGATLRIARLEVSPQYHQAILEGDGVDVAEQWLKQSGKYALDPNTEPQEAPNLQGYTCRWQDFPTTQDETIALIIKFRKKDPLYLRQVLSRIDDFVGPPEDHHPLTLQTTKVSFRTRTLASEVRVITGKRRGLKAFFYRQIIRLQNFLIHVIILTGLPVSHGKKKLQDSRRDNIRSSDYRKYDNTLRMILAVTRERRQALEAFLLDEHRQGNLFYGIHISNRAMITCLMKSDTGQEVHFVDAADGGYAYAARSLKAQMTAEPT